VQHKTLTIYISVPYML